MKFHTKTIYTISAFLLFSCISCANGDVSELLRRYDDPTDDTPQADCYSQAYSLRLSWDSDECADRYILMRAEDDGAENFMPVYSGNDSSYTDIFSMPDDQKRYLYRLDKIRGNRRFKGSDCACTVISATLNDIHEPNNTLENAVELERTIDATMPCSQFNYKERCYGDEDWYFIRLKPLCTASILFCQAGKGNSSSDSDFLYMVQGSQIKPIYHNEKFTVTNPSYSTRNIYFKILPDISKIFAGTEGAAVPAYTMTVIEETYQ